MRDKAALNTYVQSVADFIGYYQSYAGGRYALDGFDIDYEDNNVTADFPALAHMLKGALRALSSESGKPLRLTRLKRAAALIRWRDCRIG